MTKQNKYDSIFDNFIPTHFPNTTVVTLKNGVKHYGFFDVVGFENDEQLKKDNQFWFVPNNNSLAFQADLQENHRKNCNLCVRIDVDEVDNIVYQTPTKKVLKEVSFI